MVLTADSADPPSGSKERPVANVPRLMMELDQHVARFGPDHPEAIAVAHRLAVGFWCAGELDRAIGILNEALQRIRLWTDPNDPLQFDLLGTLAEILAEQGRWERAAGIHRNIVGLSITRHGEAHPSTLAAKGDLALVLFELGHDEEAARLEDQVYSRA